MADKPASEPASVEKFNQMLGHCVVSGMLSLEMYRGHRLGLFNQLSKYDTYKTSQEIADDLQMKERYIREWLNCMAAADVLALDKTEHKYFLPKERVASVSGDTAILPVWCGFIGVMGNPKIQSQINKCFKKDGPLGVDADEFDDFQDLEGEAASMIYQWDFLKTIITEVPGLVEKLESGITVLEPGCGIGNQLSIIAEKYPKSTFIGFDISTKAVAMGEELAKRKKLSNLSFIQGDACAMADDWSNKFEYVFCIDTIHDIWKPSLVLSEIYRVLKPDGNFSMIEINLHSDVRDNLHNPDAAMMYSFSINYCMCTALTQPGSDGVGTVWGKENMLQALKTAGFKQGEPKSEFDSMVVHILATK